MRLELIWSHSLRSAWQFSESRQIVIHRKLFQVNRNLPTESGPIRRRDDWFVGIQPISHLFVGGVLVRKLVNAVLSLFTVCCLHSVHCGEYGQ